MAMAGAVDFCGQLWQASMERGDVARTTVQDALVPAAGEIAEPQVPECQPFAHEAIGRIFPVSRCASTLPREVIAWRLRALLLALMRAPAPLHWIRSVQRRRLATPSQTR